MVVALVNRVEVELSDVVLSCVELAPPATGPEVERTTRAANNTTSVVGSAALPLFSMYGN